MPQMIEFPYVKINGVSKGGGPYPVATEDELLEFANKLRNAGGANILDALLPSVPTDPNECLIANALNFSCEVGVTDSPPFDGTYRYQWKMTLPYNMPEEDVAAVADSVGLTYKRNTIGDLYMLLPAHIGNAADAFDEGLAFEDYNSVGDDSDL